MHKQEAYHVCRSFMHQYVVVTLKDGHKHHGMIEKVDRDHVYLAVPRKLSPKLDSMERSAESSDRQLFWDSPYGGYPGYYPPYYPTPYPYPYSYYPGYEFQSIAIPLSFLAGVSLGRRRRRFF